MVTPRRLYLSFLKFSCNNHCAFCTQNIKVLSKSCAVSCLHTFLKDGFDDLSYMVSFVFGNLKIDLSILLARLSSFSLVIAKIDLTCLGTSTARLSCCTGHLSSGNFKKSGPFYQVLSWLRATAF